MADYGNPFGDKVRVVDGRKVNFHDIDKHIELQDGDGLTKTLAKMPLPQIKATLDNSIAKGDFAMADRARAAAAMRKSGVPPELCGPGQLHEVNVFDMRDGRLKSSYFGDSKVWRSQFECAAVGIEFTPLQAFEQHKGEVSINGSETLIARSPDGKERVVHIKKAEQPTAAPAAEPSAEKPAGFIAKMMGKK